MQPRIVASYTAAVPKSYLVLDIETVPDRELWQPPAAPAGNERDMPPTYACRIVVMGALWLDEDLSLTRMGVFERWQDEAELLRNFSQFMGKEKPDLITFNGRRFDLPVIVQRSLHHGVPLPWFYTRSDYRYRYSIEGHFDLCDWLAEYGATKMISLDAAARLIGLPGKGELDGSQVEGLFRAGQVETLRGYCLSDVAQTAFLFLRMRYLMGAMDVEAYRRAARALFEAVGTDERVTLQVSDTKRLLLEAED